MIITDVFDALFVSPCSVFFSLSVAHLDFTQKLYITKSSTFRILKAPAILQFIYSVYSLPLVHCIFPSHTYFISRSTAVLFHWWHPRTANSYIATPFLSFCPAVICFSCTVHTRTVLMAVLFRHSTFI